MFSKFRGHSVLVLCYWCCRVAASCFGTTQRCASIFTPTGHVCTSVPSVASRLSRAPSSNDTSLCTLEKSRFRLVIGSHK